MDRQGQTYASARTDHALGRRGRLAARGTRPEGASPLGFLASGAAGSANSAVQIDGIKQGLRDNGLIDGQDYILDARFAAGNYERFPELARELAQAGARMILVNTIASVRAAQNLVPPLPVVMLAINDPVGTALSRTSRAAGRVHDGHGDLE